MNILLIGPLPHPVTGEALANQTFLNYLRKNHIQHAYINTTGYKNIQSSHGKFTLSKLLQFIGVYQNIPKIVRHKGVVYITIGQTFFGVIKYAPFIVTAILLKKPYYLHLHGNYLGHTYQSLSGIKKKWFKWLISHAKGGIVLSESLKPNFQHLLPEKKIKEVENFADDGLYQIDISHKQFQELHLLFLSNLYPEKGIEDFLDALLMLQQADIPFKASIGGAFEMSSKSRVIQKMNKIDKTSLKYHGFVSGSKKQALLQQANVFVLPTYYKIEAQPISIIEALATGNIIVTTRQGGIPDFISEKQGFFVEKKNPVHLFETLKYLSDHLSGLSHLSQENRQYALQRFSEVRFGDNLLQILN
jgi:glycosyltransferase involved in cell wall biosynthesis